MEPDAVDSLRLSDQFWARRDVRDSLRVRDMRKFFRLVRKYNGTTQAQIGEAVGLQQGYVSKVMTGARVIEQFDVFQRIAEGMSMPDDVRLVMGLAPRGSAEPSVDE